MWSSATGETTSEAGEYRDNHKNHGVGKGLAEEEVLSMGCVEGGWREGSSAPAQELAWGWFYSMILLRRTAAAVKAHQ